MSVGVQITLIICATLIVLVFASKGNNKNDERVEELAKSLLDLAENVLEPMENQIFENKDLIGKIMVALHKKGIEVEDVKAIEIPIGDMLKDIFNAKQVKVECEVGKGDSDKESAETDKCDSQDVDCPSK